MKNEKLKIIGNLKLKIKEDFYKTYKKTLQKNITKNIAKNIVNHYKIF
jgi:hypothetical protein